MIWAVLEAQELLSKLWSNSINILSSATIYFSFADSRNGHLTWRPFQFAPLRLVMGNYFECVRKPPFLITEIHIKNKNLLFESRGFSIYVASFFTSWLLFQSVIILEFLNSKWTDLREHTATVPHAPNVRVILWVGARESQQEWHRSSSSQDKEWHDLQKYHSIRNTD